ncbi:MAG: hypothetical protein ACR2NR_22095 [Solirubrobacteraceae bacterium]
MPPDVFHLELRQFPHVARVFNLDRDELDGRFLRPWVVGTMIDHDDRRWAPERCKLKVLDGPEVRADELGLGRGWGAATKESLDVTDAVIADAQRGAQSRPETEALKEALLEVAVRPIGFADVIDLAAIGHPGWRASEQLSVAEQAVWELLHQGRVTMLADGEAVAPERWQEVVLRFATWKSGREDSPLRLQAATGPPEATGPPGAVHAGG